jgi:hypothetical protein
LWQVPQPYPRNGPRGYQECCLVIILIINILSIWTYERLWTIINEVFNYIIIFSQIICNNSSSSHIRLLRLAYDRRRRIPCQHSIGYINWPWTLWITSISMWSWSLMIIFRFFQVK